MSEFELQSETQFASVQDAAGHYVKLGWEPLPLPARQKSPVHKWGTPVDWTEDEIDRKFDYGGNIGVALGSRSSNLVDIDFDWPEAAKIARAVLADLPSFGRSGSPNSHRVATCELPKSSRFQIPKKAEGEFSADRMTVLELRSNGSQTMFPPSVHPNGEIVRWHDDPADLPTIDPDDLKRRAGLVAFLAVVLNKYPRVAGDRDNVCLALTGALVRVGLEDGAVDAYVELIAPLAGDDEAENRGGKAATTREKLNKDEQAWGLPELCERLCIAKIEATLRKWIGVGPALDRPADGDADSIVVLPGFLPLVVDEAEQALLDKKVDVYQRFDSIVRVVRLTVSVDEEGVNRDTGALVIKPVTSTWLREQLARVAKWTKPQKSGARRIDPPMEIATTYIARVGDWRLRFLQGVTQSPTLRADGTVLQKPGYDPASGMLYDPGVMSFPAVSDAPTEEDAKAALDTLSRPFRDFCFASKADRSVALAAALTAIVRPMFSSAPLFALDAPEAGTGKSLLAETIGVIATGHKPAMTSQGVNPEEDQKRLSSVLMAGDQIIVIDNCERPIQGDFLCSMLTQEVVQPRVLGKSEVRRLPTRCLVVATGNNLVLSGDVTRRALICRLDAGVERPDQRQFDFDAVEEAMRDRVELVASGLTILRAYIAASRPNPMKRIGSFENWNLVREALVWLGCDDPALTRERVLTDDPKKAVLVDLLRLWRQVLGDKAVTLAQLSMMAETDNEPGVRLLVTELVANTRYGTFNARSVGRYLSKHVDRIAGGFVLRAETDGSGIKSYRVFAPKSRGETKSDSSPF